MSTDELQKEAGTPAPEATTTKATPAPATPPVAIPEAAQAEIKRLHADLVTKARDFEAARGAFGEYLRVAKQLLQIPAKERWEILEDASAFVKLPEGQ